MSDLTQTTLDGQTLGLLEDYKKLRDSRVYVKWPADTVHLPVAFRISDHWNKGASVVGRAYDDFGLVYLGTWYNWVREGFVIDPGKFTLKFIVTDLIRIFYHEFFHLWFRKRLPREDRDGFTIGERKIQDYKGKSRAWEKNEDIVEAVAKIFCEAELNYIGNLETYLSLFRDLKLPIMGEGRD